jgi:hypothetical protein
MFTTSILNVGEKKNYFAKNIRMVSNTWNLLFKLSKSEGPIQVLASALKKHNYINLFFESNANSS